MQETILSVIKIVNIFLRLIIEDLSVILRPPPRGCRGGVGHELAQVEEVRVHLIATLLLF